MDKVNVGDKQKQPYSYVGIPKELYDEIERLITNKGLGYRSVAEFVRDAVREKILEILSITGRCRQYG